MRNLVYSLIFVSLALVSCIETPTSQLEKQAIESFKASFSKSVGDDKDAKFENIKAVFSSDNLCIIHADLKAKSGLDVNIPNKIEYLFITQDGKSYEAYQDLSDDSVYVSEPTLKNISKGMIYENLDFEGATFYRAAIYTNNYGREVGTHKTDFTINIPIKTRLWEICYAVDEFGDKADGKFLRLTGKGTFSEDDETNEKLIAYLFVNKEEDIVLRLVENGTKVTKPWGVTIKFKDGEGKTHEIPFTGLSSGDLRPSSMEKNSKDEFRKMIEKEGVLSAIAVTGGGMFSTKKTYKFKFNLDGFEKAMLFLQSGNNQNRNQYDNSESDDEDIDSEVEDVNEEDIEFSISEAEPVDEEIGLDKNTNNTTDEVVSNFDTPPSFEEGDIYEWLQKHLRYPEDAKEMGTQGKVFVSFIIEKDGSTSNIAITKSIGRQLDSEAIRLVKMMKWRPAKQNDEFVRSRYNLVIPFSL